MNSRRQRYFRSGSPSGREMDVLDQSELVMEGDPGDEQQISHEEIVDETGNEMTIDRIRNIRQRQSQIHYESRTYTVPPAQPRRPGRPTQRYPGQPLPIDVVEKLQNKNTYLARTNAHQMNRISPGGARIVSLPGASRKREAVGTDAMLMKRMTPSGSQPYGMRGVQQMPNRIGQKGPGNSDVKVVRLVPNSLKSNPQTVESNLVELEERIKQTMEDSKCDIDKLKQLQHQDLSNEEYGQMLRWLVNELERLNNANNSLTDSYRQRQRNEKIVYENREDLYTARIRQLESENRKLREAMLVMYQTRLDNFEQNMMRHEEVQQHEDHMGQIMEGDGDHVVIERHMDTKQEEVPEWIVEETVDDIQLHDHVGDEGNEKKIVPQFVETE